MWNIVAKLIASKFGKLVGLLACLVIICLVKQVVFPKKSWFWWVVAMGVITLVWIIWLIYEWRKDQVAARGLDKSMKEASQKDVASKRPDKQAAYLKSKENFEYAITLLERSRPKGYRGGALYRLPWILVVGFPADGKTTAIENAGIRFPVDPRKDEAGGGGAKKREIEGVGGTKSCNWFFTSDGVILDTAGRYMAREAGEVDEAEWKEFLEMIQKFRPKRPVNGLVALCSIEKVMTGKDTAREFAQKVRRQINEIMENLQTHVPVYLVFNKCDLIHGFVEFFGDLDLERRNQVWGFTREYKPKLRKSGIGVESELDTITKDLEREISALCEGLERRRLLRLSAPDLHPSERAALCIFPGEFRAAIEPLKEFVSNIFYDSAYGNNPILRGVYFTSAWQHEGNPIVALMEQVAGEYNIPLEALPFSRQQVTQYFLHDLFNEIIFKDENLGGRFKKSVFDRTRRILVGCVAGLAALIGVWMSVSYFVGSNRNSELYRQAIKVKGSDFKNNPSEALVQLDLLREKKEDYISQGFPFGLFYWLFDVEKDGRLALAADSLLAAKVDQHIVNPAWESSRYALRGGASSDLFAYITSFRTYLYLSTSNNSPSDELDTLVAQYVMRESMIRQGAEARVVPGLNQKLAMLLAAWRANKHRQSREVDAKLLPYARGQIQNAWNWTRIVHDLVDSYGDAQRYFSPKIFNFESDFPRVEQAFRFVEWDQTFRSRLVATYESYSEDTVLVSILGDRMKSASGNPLMDKYYVEALAAWRQFFQVIADDPTWSLNMTQRSKYFIKLLKEAASETRFSDPVMSNEFKELRRFTGIWPQSGVLDNLPNPTDAKAPSEPPPIDTYDALLDKVRAKVPPPKSAQCAEGFGQAKADLANLASQANDIVPGGTLRRLLMGPFTDASVVLGGNTRKCLNQIWHTNVITPFGDISALYPFDRAATGDADIQAIGSFFGAGGPLLAFDAQEGKPAIQTGFNLSPAYNGLLGLRGKIIQRFGGAGASINLDISQSLVDENIKKITLSGGGQYFVYEQGAPDVWVLPLPWNGAELTMTVESRQKEIIYSIVFPGVWAPLRLLDRANVTGNTGTLKFVGSNNKTYEFKVKLANSTGDNPVQFLRNFVHDLPEQIAP
jgi:type VI protein secretion system component VasK